MILDNLYMKFAVWRAGRFGHKMGRAVAEGRARPPAAVTDSLETLLDDLAPPIPHICFGTADGNLIIGMEDKRDAFKERFVRNWVANFRVGYAKALAETGQSERIPWE